MARTLVFYVGALMLCIPQGHAMFQGVTQEQEDVRARLHAEINQDLLARLQEGGDAFDAGAFIVQVNQRVFEYMQTGQTLGAMGGGPILERSMFIHAQDALSLEQQHTFDRGLAYFVSNQLLLAYDPVDNIALYASPNEPHVPTAPASLTDAQLRERILRILTTWDAYLTKGFPRLLAFQTAVKRGEARQEVGDVLLELSRASFTHTFAEEKRLLDYALQKENAFYASETDFRKDELFALSTDMDRYFAQLRQAMIPLRV